MDKQKLVITYKRVSTDGQEEKFGLEAQNDLLNSYIEKNGLTVVAEFVDVFSGASDSRPELDNILNSDEFRGMQLIVPCNDRLARTVDHFFYIKNRLNKAGIELISIKEEKTENETSNLVLETVSVLVGNIERNNITSRTSGGRKVKAKHGGYAGGKAPYGYYVFNKGLAIHNDEARIVLFVFDCLKQEYSIQKICDSLEEQGFTTRSGKSKWNKATVHGIIKNKEFYSGAYRYSDQYTENGEHIPLLKEREVLSV